ncbi:MAG: DUF389 domain-containing protein [Anaerolineae bacterium]|nr:DUF389 domain-containing protein [Anaerolineae bacterium]
MTDRRVREETDSRSYTILVAVGEPGQFIVLLSVAVPLARSRGGCVVPLYVGPIAQAPSWLQVPSDMTDVVTTPQVVAGRDIGKAILSFARKLRPDLLLLHWRGEPARGRYLLGRTLDPVITYAPCDVAVVRVTEPPSAFARRMAHLQRILVPSGGGPNASLALRLALDLSRTAKVTALRVANPGLGHTAISAQWDILRSVLEPWKGVKRLRPLVTLSSGVVEGILEEAQQGYDLVLIGATRESFLDRLLFGNLPQELAARVSLPLIIVRRHDPRAVGALRRARWRLLGLLPQLTLDERVGIYRQVRRGSRTNKDFYIMMILAAGIASLGLQLDSSAVIIGAMLMAPMMTALLGVGMGIVQGDVWLLRLALRTAVLGSLVVVGVGALVGIVVPGDQVTTEMLRRSRPTLLDLAIALLSGAAGAYALSRRNVASALPGVAIAVALVPPLATIGLTAVAGAFRASLGALLLFLTNLVASVAAAAVIFMWMGFRPGVGEERRRRTFQGGLVGTAILLGCVTVVLAVLSIASVRELNLQRTVQYTVERRVEQLKGARLESWRIIEKQRGQIHLEVSVQAEEQVERDWVIGLQNDLEKALGKRITLSLIVIPISQVEPSVSRDK